MSSKEENTPIIVETIPEFNKNYSTRTIYNELINNGYSTDAAIEKVCHKLDIFCSNTPNSIYLIDRYTEFYNHNKITKPLGVWTPFVLLKRKVRKLSIRRVFTELMTAKLQLANRIYIHTKSQYLSLSQPSTNNP